MCIVVRKLPCVIGIAHQQRKWTIPENGSQLWDLSVLITLCCQKNFAMAGLRKLKIRMQGLHTLAKAICMADKLAIEALS